MGQGSLTRDKKIRGTVSENQKRPLFLRERIGDKIWVM